MKFLLASLCASVAGAGWWTWPGSPCEETEGPCTARVECIPSQDVCVIECEGPDGEVCSYEISCSELPCSEVSCAELASPEAEIEAILAEDCESLATGCALPCR